jgi:CheY-like chemotaxis protein/two-component sensor histidine kinase
MSHELRNPLNSLLLLSRMLAENSEHNLSPKQIEFATTIHSAGSDLLSLIDDILDLSKIEAGRVDINPSQVQLAEIPRYLDTIFRHQAEQKGLDLRLTVDPGLTTIVTDLQRLQQILRNLLSNAVKFTSAGSVQLTIEPGGVDAETPVGLAGAERSVRFVVQDTGIGISSEKLEMIFEAFQQADGTTSRRFGGTGLGLSISKELARLLGGMITVSSETGAGSTFTLTLPPEAPATTSGSPPEADDRETPKLESEGTAAEVPILRPGAPPSTVLSRMSMSDVTVLIVDDDVRNVFALTSALEPCGVTVLYADSGMDGIQLLTDHPEVTIVLMDSMMPEQDGNETTRRMRELPSGADIPILFLTAKAMPEDRRASLAAGASDYITKPVDLDELLSTMSSWVDVIREAPSRVEGGPR